MALLRLDNCWLGFNDRELLRGVSLSVDEGERIGLLGRNGCGKSTLLKVLAGVETPDSGQRVLRRGARLGYLEQDPEFAADQTVREAVREGLPGRGDVLAELEELHAALAEDPGDALDALLGRQTRLEARLDELGGHDIEHRIESTLQALGLDQFEAKCGNLSGGERRRVALARLQLARPDLLLLDEPTNHLDAFVTERLESWFLETKTPLLLVTHDRYFLDRVVDRIVELDRGELVTYDGGYADYLEQRAARLSAEDKAESSRLNLLRRETAWMRRGPPARTTRSKARVKQFHALVDSKLDTNPADLELLIPPGPRLGSRVVNLRGVTKSFGGRLIVPPLDLEIEAGTRLGVVGPNGAGKSTLLKLILGQLQPDAGEREIGETVQFMGIDQMRSELDPGRTVTEVVAGASGVVRSGDNTIRVESFLGKFGFPPSMQKTQVSQLSGGEQNRVLLAKLLCAGGNVLVLDEPTNDLDLATLRALEEALLVFPGALILVSHDRWFLDRVATRILYLDGKGGLHHHHGDLSQLLQNLTAAEAEAKLDAAKVEKPKPKKAAAPTRAKRIAPWEQRELDEVEAKIPTLESEIGQLDEKLADPELYRGPIEDANRIQARRGELETELATLYERWEALEALRSGE